MKLPTAITKIIKPKSKQKNIYVSLILESDHVAGACFYISDGSVPKLLHAVLRKVADNDWQDRIAACDQVISALEARLESETISDVILGLPQSYLGADGNIKSDIKANLKKLTEQLELNPIGFVSLQDAIVYKLKYDDGVPASVILLLVADAVVDLFVYRVGKMVGYAPLKLGATVLSDIETALKSITDIEVLPSKIFIYGANKDQVQILANKLTTYSWPEKVNFLHIPKVEILTSDILVRSVSFAGAGELKRGAIITGQSEITPSAQSQFIVGDEIDNSSKAYKPDIKSHTNVRDAGSDSVDNKTDAEDGQVDELVHHDTVDVHIQKESPDAARTVTGIPDENQDDITEESNVQVVNPEDIGFRPNEDVLDESYNLKTSKKESKRYDEPIDEEIKETPQMERPQAEVVTNILSAFGKLLSSVKGHRLLAVLGFGALAIVYGLFYVLFSILPHVTVKISVDPVKINQQKVVTVDPNTTTINPEKMIVPAKKLDHTVSGEEIIKVTGTKNIGDPATGQIIIYNKSLSGKTLKKGSALTSNGLSFTLNDEVKVASATESIGSITFGKTTAAITAAQIGTKSNLAQNSEFEFADYDTDILIARNEQPLFGGTSREVTVVTRKDYDTLTKKATDKLISQAKGELAQNVGGSQILIDDTIAVNVTDKTFQEELDQEAKELHGKITLTVSGYAYDQVQIQTLFTQSLSASAPPGYSLNSDNIQVTLSDIQVKKTGIIQTEADASALAIPQLKPDEIKAALAGKSISAAQEYLKTLSGITEVNFLFSVPYAKSKIPKRIANIQLEIEVKK
ncbi:hypothetical protein A2154_00190 [Candidatus Gottesmanbacteria bacterium RBG_16_43_7]|uniref:Baseplate protein J-like domain-containing protein n=1 Tax=Candidatus Gottesmanbacteria bacterium RBG_16_43_7 TaxID=1798373 RepID=A0A1F5Z964_9BACT|nr:MAG: hypothetical protein A2154_00190 [Candidatus Gottesmanbacteria bacterium RBG_16_43_7]